MMHFPTKIQAELFTRIPEAFHYSGEPTDWVKMTRPGLSLHSFLEGLQFDPEGQLWLCDVPYGRIFRITADGDWSIAYNYDGEPHSLRTDQHGQHLVVDYQHGLIAIPDDQSQYKVLARDTGNGPFKGLSDLTIAPDHTVWFTDSGRTSLSDPSGGLYRFNATQGLQCVLDNIPYPNGIAVSTCGTYVYVAVTRANAIWRLFANPPDTGMPGSAPPMVGIHIQLSGGLGPDGLATNANGYLAVAQAQAGRAYVFNSFGDGIAEIHLPQGLWTTSVAFHPQREDELYIVDAQTGSIYFANIGPPQ